MTSHNRFKSSDVLWIALELTAPLLIVGAIIVWAIDRFRGETFVAASSRVVLAAFLVALVVVLAARIRARRGRAGSIDTNGTTSE